MDLHVPEAPIRSVKDFLIHIVIVTIGILIALGLEQLVESHHRARLAADAVAGFRRELTDDRKQLDEILAALPKAHEEVAQAIARLDSPDPGRIDYPRVHFDILSTSSWDAALATQALAELPYGQAHRYAEAYAALLVVAKEEWRGLDGWQGLHAYGDDAGKLTPDQRRALIERLRRYESYMVIIESAGHTARTECDKALGDKPHA